MKVITNDVMSWSCGVGKTCHFMCKTLNFLGFTLRNPTLYLTTKTSYLGDGMVDYTITLSYLVVSTQPEYFDAVS
ncbi:hypothetical protein LU290_01225 [Moraxella nasibovis]|uniref:hypothetical protein n=1 Tax=Moraxella nasibovis TaxID=2904120 RepID=UPI00240EF97B|nr:hypothetical protein [Moraxella nasibovis]WFF38891.1 hypothetical protein LU290_01225 [Moraxella nasibovis]